MCRQLIGGSEPRGVRPCRSANFKMDHTAVKHYYWPGAERRGIVKGTMHHLPGVVCSKQKKLGHDSRPLKRSKFDTYFFRRNFVDKLIVCAHQSSIWEMCIRAGNWVILVGFYERFLLLIYDAIRPILSFPKAVHRDRYKIDFYFIIKKYRRIPPTRP